MRCFVALCAPALLTEGAMNQYCVGAEANIPRNYSQAYDYVVQYATLCSLSTMKELLDQQIAFPSSSQASVRVVPQLEEGAFQASKDRIFVTGRPTHHELR
jgi:hypothetical protein